MKSIKYITSCTATDTEQVPQRVLVLDTTEAVETALLGIRMRTIFPHKPVLDAGDSYSEWYARVCDVWQRRRQAELEAAPTDDLQRVINSVMTDRLATARATCTTLH